MSEPASIIFPADVESADGTSIRASFDDTNEAEPREALSACTTDRAPAQVVS